MGTCMLGKAMNLWNNAKKKFFVCGYRLGLVVSSISMLLDLVRVTHIYRIIM